MANRRRRNVTAALLAGLTLFDIAAATAAPPPPPPLPFSWSGFYLGADIGGRQATNNLNARQSFDGATFDAGRTVSSQTFVGGIYGGYNWQVLPYWVVGIEGAASYGGGSNSIDLSFVPVGVGRRVVLGTSVSVDQNWDAAIRGRVGFLIPGTSSLIYGAGGVSWLDQSINGGSNVRTGYTVGGGWETPIAGGWIGRLEYLYSDYGRFNYSPNLAVNTQTNTIRVGIARRLGP